MLKWVFLGIVVIIAGFYFVAARNSRKKCIFAFGQGVVDAGKLSWTEIRSRFDSFLKPMRAEDAAAYRRGLEYSLSAGSDTDLDGMKRCFLDAYSSGTITREGSEIKKLGLESASRNFNLRIPQEVMLKIQDNPEIPPLTAKTIVS